MLKTIIQKNSYKDSIVLMLLTNDIAEMEGVDTVSIMMATPANKDIFDDAGLLTEEVKEAKADDIAIVMEIDKEARAEEVLKAIDDFFNKDDEKKKKKTSEIAKSWEEAEDAMPETNLALFSIPGIYAAKEAEKALDLGKHVFLFSDNVELEDEVRLKKKAHALGLLFMGPDSGTGIISGVPLAFTNKVREGSIGVVGASGTGIQEVTTLVHKLGMGISSAIGTGGRDLNEEVGAITMLDSLNHLSKKEETKVLVVISKPPSESVKNKVEGFLRTLDKPVVTIFLGEEPKFHEPNMYHAYTLDEAAHAAVRLAEGENVDKLDLRSEKEAVNSKLKDKTIKGYYAGGTLALEAAMLIANSLSLKLDSDHKDGVMISQNGFEIIDMGDDSYTQGHPHPMMDPHFRKQKIEAALDDPNTGIVLFDLVLGYGSHDNMAGALADSIIKVSKQAKNEDRELIFVATVCGTDLDYQNYAQQVKILEDAGVKVYDSNAKASIAALEMLGHNFEYEILKTKEVEKMELESMRTSPLITELLSEAPRVLNIGLRSFAEDLEKERAEVLQYDWQPLAGGNQELIDVLDFLDKVEL